MKYLSLLLSLVLFTSCNQENLDTNKVWEKYIIRSEISDTKNVTYHKRLSASEILPQSNWLTYIDDIDHFEISYPADEPENSPIFMKNMSIERTTSGCSPQVLGTWDYTVKEMTVGNDKALWGRADYYDGSNNPGWEPNPETVCEGDIGGALYSFCSEKNGKTVVICFLQGTKDEALAESIFQTFRWTK